MYPNNQQYKDSVRNKYFFKEGDYAPSLYDPQIKDGELIFERGQRAVVYKVKCGDTKENKGLKLFLDENLERQYRFNEISNFLKGLKCNYFVGFRYIEKLIFVPDNISFKQGYFPGLEMDWADGKSLESVVRELTDANDIESLRKLTLNFKTLSFFIINSEFGHGDLKHDNIIVDQDLSFKLIDYDDLFVPSLHGKRAVELGTMSFQHPKRTTRDFNERIDDFSILTIYVSLLAFSKYPSYYKRFSDQQNLFFRKEDFIDPLKSEIFDLLLLDLELLPYAKAIILSLSKDDIYIPELRDYLNGVFPSPAIIHYEGVKYNFYEGESIVISFQALNFNEIEVYANNNRVDNSSISISDDIITLTPSFTINSILKVILKNTFVEIYEDIPICICKRVEVTKLAFSDSFFKKSSDVIFRFELSNHHTARLLALGNENFVKVLNGNKGDIRFSIEETDTYFVEIQDKVGNIMTAGKHVLQVIQDIKINRFEAEYTNILEGIPIDLMWDVDNADIIELITDRNEKDDVSGLTKISISPIKNVTYRLDCSNRFYKRSSTQKVQINVVANPHKLSLANLTPNLDGLNLSLEVESIDLSLFDLTIPELDLSLNLQVSLTEDLNIDVKEIDNQTLKSKIINLFKFKK
ncbi:hypothetical protein [Sphingobacterium faecium]